MQIHAAKSRFYFLAGLLASGFALAFAYYLEFGRGLEPCPLCILQRIAMFAVALVCLLGLAHGPRLTGRRIYAALGAVAALAGAGIAARHVWLMHLPPDQVPACGPGLDYLVDIMPWQEVLLTILRGDASCATVEGSFLGISLPAWTLLCFMLLFVAALAGLLPGGRSKHNLDNEI
ncbi:MAG TPA: disulfide bond formation protein B [Salinisphaeraceae bacterium]|nr:disulfide bond formation protein B [Salinisphaeraceae bacterium]